MKRNLIFCVMLLGGHMAAKAQSAPISEGMELNDSSSQVTNLAATVKDKSKVLLNWRLPRNSSKEFVAVERSSNGRDFEMVAVLKQAAAGDWYEWVDDAPEKGKNAYRIKHAARSGVEQYSLIASVVVAGDISFRFYPNPVDNILILRSEQATDVQVIDGNGNLRLTFPRIQGLQTVNVGTLEKGIYVLRISNRVTGTVTQEKLLKN